MRLDEPADLQRVTDPETREAYREIAERLFKEAKSLVERNMRGESKVVQRDAIYCWLVACGRTPKYAETKAAAEVRSGWKKEIPTDPDDLPHRDRMPELDGRPNDPLEFIQELRLDPDYVTVVSRFSEAEWRVVCLLDGMQYKAWEAADILKCSTKAVERAYARARSKYGAARTDYDDWKALG